MRKGTGDENLNSTNTKELKKFGVALGCALLFWALIPLVKQQEPRLYLLVPAVLILTLGLFRPSSLKQVHKRWAQVTSIIGSVLTTLTLLIVFYLVITPLGLLKKIFGADTQKFCPVKDQPSYWIKKNQLDIRESMRRLF